MSTAKKVYLKLGKNASSFNDPKSGLNLAGKQVAAIDSNLAASSKVVQLAIKNGHLIKVEETEFKNSKMGVTFEAPQAAAKAAPAKAAEEDEEDEEEVEDVDEDDEEGEEDEDDEPKPAEKKKKAAKKATAAKKAGKK